MREQTLLNVQHPDAINGAAVIVDPQEMNGLLDRLHNGDPTLGFEGDPRLCLAFNKLDQRWELHRLERDNQYRLLARSKPNMRFPDNIIETLIAHDTRRGFDPKAAVDAHNARLEAERSKASSEFNQEAARRLGWGIKKDTRIGAGI